MGDRAWRQTILRASSTAISRSVLPPRSEHREPFRRRAVDRAPLCRGPGRHPRCREPARRTGSLVRIRLPLPEVAAPATAPQPARLTFLTLSRELPVMASLRPVPHATRAFVPMDLSKLLPCCKEPRRAASISITPFSASVPHGQAGAALHPLGRCGRCSLLPDGWTIHRLGELSNCKGGTSGWVADIYRPADAMIAFPSEVPATTAALALCIAACASGSAEPSAATSRCRSRPPSTTATIARASASVVPAKAGTQRKRRRCPSALRGRRREFRSEAIAR